MRFHHLNNRRGMTFVEVMVVCGLLSMTLMGALAIMLGSIDQWSAGVSADTANSAAGLGIQKLARNIEEGNSASISASKLVVAYPKYDETNNYYEKGTTDHTFTYYLSGTTGAETTGTNLWMQKSTGERTLLMRNVSAATFTATGGRYVTITITGRFQEGNKDKEKSITRTTSVRLRN